MLYVNYIRMEVAGASLAASLPNTSRTAIEANGSGESGEEQELNEALDEGCFLCQHYLLKLTSRVDITPLLILFTSILEVCELFPSPTLLTYLHRHEEKWRT